MPNPVTNIIRDSQRVCCATCKHAHLVSYAPHDPLLAECHLQPQPDNLQFPYVVMVANIQWCKKHDWRHKPAEIEYREKKRLNLITA